MYAFGTSHSRHTFTFDQFLLSLEIKPKTFVLLTPCSTVRSIWCEVQFMEVKKNLQGKMKWKESFSQSFWRLVCFVDDVLDRVAYYWACVCVCVCVCVCLCARLGLIMSSCCCSVSFYLLTLLCWCRPSLSVLISLHLQGGLDWNILTNRLH